MPVNLTNPTSPPEQILAIQGLNIAVTSAEIRKKNRDDICLMVFDDGASVGGVFTQNSFCAAPVQVCRQNISNNIRGLIINSGCANAATGEQGLADAIATTECLAKLINVNVNQILPFSTGVILELLPMEKMISGITTATKKLYPANSSTWLSAARAIMTTDTVAKVYSATDGAINVTGIAKGAGMIHPNMATMLGFVTTDANISQDLLSALTLEIAEETFNAITIDGDTSTNDSFVIIATNKVGEKITTTTQAEYQIVKKLLLEVSRNLALAIVRDGEGASKFISINVKSAFNKAEAKKVAEKIALSPLVKTAFFASDPNLGRILCAIGNSAISNVDINKINLTLSAKGNQVLVAENGGRAKSYNKESEKIANEIMQEAEFNLEINLGRGVAEFTKYTCDFGYEYVKINAEYRT